MESESEGQEKSGEEEERKKENREGDVPFLILSAVV